MTTFHDLAIIEHLLRHSPASPDPVSAFGEWKRAWAQLVSKWESPIDRTLAGGLAADRPAWAFAAGYQGAIQCLPHSLGISEIDGISAICITEKDGAHPARIKSRLTPLSEKPGYWRLDGFKTFISGGTEADILWVAASTGKTAEGRNQLRMVRIPSQSKGITLSPMPPLGIVPEMPHSEVRFESVVVSDGAILPGDAYTESIKPFRTLEDLHVTAAFLAWLFGMGRRGKWPEGILEKILSLIVSARGLSFAPPLAPHIHITLGGFLRQMRFLLTEINSLWEKIDPVTQKRWKQDSKILEIAEKARRKRLSAAWRNYKV